MRPLCVKNVYCKQTKLIFTRQHCVGLCSSHNTLGPEKRVEHHECTGQSQNTIFSCGQHTLVEAYQGKAPLIHISEIFLEQ